MYDELKQKTDDTFAKWITEVYRIEKNRKISIISIYCYFLEQNENSRKVSNNKFKIWFNTYLKIYNIKHDRGQNSKYGIWYKF